MTTNPPDVGPISDAKLAVQRAVGTLCGVVVCNEDEWRGLIARLQAAEARAARAEVALAFYRDEWFENAEGDGSIPGHLRTWREPTDALWSDAGDKARRALTREAPERKEGE